MRIDTYMQQLRDALSTMPRAERDAVLAEIRSHLEERVAEHQAQGLPRDAAVAEAVAAFGPANEVAVQFQGSHAIVRGGNQVLRVMARTGRAAGRGAGQIIKYTFVTVAGIVLVAVVAALVLLVAYKDVVELGVDEASSTRYRVLVERYDMWSEPQTRVEQDSFQIGDWVRTSKVTIDVRPGSALGCVHVIATGPNDASIYDSGLRCGEGIDYAWSPVEQGSYQIEYRFVGWSGDVFVHGWALERDG